MRISTSWLLSALICLLHTSRVLAWGVAGHQIVATIAQIHLLPSVRDKLCEILPYNARCHLAPYAAWADSIKGKPEWRWTSSLHYVNGVGDYPAEKCVFGEQGWTSEKNVLTALVNVTAEIHEYTGSRQDIALRFLTHYLGDLHMPMHLSGRDRGGNDDHVKFEGRMTNLHSVWDTLLITKSIREQSNYTRPLPSKRIESALRGSIYDPYVRWIVWEGIRGWWADEWLSWPLCPAEPELSSIPTLKDDDDNVMNLDLLTQQEDQFVLPDVADASGKRRRPKRPQQPEEPESPKPAPPHGPIDPPDLPICPLHWARPLHDLNCKYVWPPHYDTHGRAPELDTPTYLGPIRDQHVVERMLAMAGVRLAGVLNSLLGGEEGTEASGRGMEVLRAVEGWE